MLHQYKFVGGNYEGSRTTVLCHTEFFTKEQFHKLVVEAAPLALLRKARSEGPLYNATSTLADLHDEIVEILCTRWGFDTTEYAAEFSFFNWTGLNDQGFNRAAKGTEAEDMVKAIKEAGFPPEFFTEWSEFRTPYHNQPYYGDPDYEAGLDAGLAFRLNEIAGRRVFTKVTPRTVYEDE